MSSVLLTFPRHSSAKSYCVHLGHPLATLANILGNSAHYNLCSHQQLRKQGCDTFAPSLHVQVKGCIAKFHRHQCARSGFDQLLA